ncbi:DUF6458 family protein [Micromonospora sp. KLBMP9576]|uniref:DUF6458 family protein n=1 Tax=Micromonospora sp. KLBMP9576 TaxID=3424769 RepID=UPI003D93961B
MRYQLRYVRVSPVFVGDEGNSTRRQDRLARHPAAAVGIDRVGQVEGGARPGCRHATGPDQAMVALVNHGVLTSIDSTPHPLTKEAVVGIGTSIFLIALGAILTFALDANLGGIDLDVVGWILMAAGVLGLIMTTLIWGRRRQVVSTAAPVEYQRVEERRDVAPPL